MPRLPTQKFSETDKKKFHEGKFGKLRTYMYIYTHTHNYTYTYVYSERVHMHVQGSGDMLLVCKLGLQND